MQMVFHEDDCEINFSTRKKQQIFHQTKRYDHLAIFAKHIYDSVYHIRILTNSVETTFVQLHEFLRLVLCS
jgi:hypothetical protein